MKKSFLSRALKVLQPFYMVSVGCALAACAGGHQDYPPMEAPNNEQSSSSSSSSSSTSSSSSSSSGVGLVFGTPEIYKECSPDTPDAWPCSLALPGNDSFYCDEEGTCTYLVEANGYVGWTYENCHWEVKPEGGCTYMTPTRIAGCENDNCGSYNRVAGLVEPYQARCSHWGEWYVPCSVNNACSVRGCTSGECGSMTTCDETIEANLPAASSLNTLFGAEG